jgi:hypothetical protein
MSRAGTVAKPCRPPPTLFLNLLSLNTLNTFWYSKFS